MEIVLQLEDCKQEILALKQHTIGTRGETIEFGEILDFSRLTEQAN